MSINGVPTDALTLDQRRAALRAGSMGYLIISGGLIVDGVVAAIIIFALGFLNALSGLSTGDEASDASQASTSMTIAFVLSVAGLIGVGIVAIGLNVSHGILVRSFVHRPRAVVWAGFGISSIPTMLFSLLFLVGYLVTNTGRADNSGDGAVIVAIAFAVVFGLIDSVITPLLAGYAFLWMAHVIRARAQPIVGFTS